MMFTSHSAPRIQPQKALILIDFQNDFVDQVRGKLAVSNTQSFIERLPSLATQFRAKGPVVFVRTEFQEARSAISPEVGSYNILLQEHLPRYTSSPPSGRKHRRGKSSGTFKPVSREAFLQRNDDAHSTPCYPGTFGADLCPFAIDSYNPKWDLNIVKSHYSAFQGTSLLTQLRTRMIQHVYVAGSLSNISVYATVVDAVRHGLEVTLIEDCLGYRDLDIHHEAIKHMVDLMGANGIDYSELMDDLAGLLGDVIREADLGPQFQISISQTSAQPRISASSERVNHRVKEWVTEHDERSRRVSRNSMGGDGMSENAAVENSPGGDSHPNNGLTPANLQKESSGSTLPDGRPAPDRQKSTVEVSPSVASQPSVRLSPSESTRYKFSRPRLRGPDSDQPVTPSSSKHSTSPQPHAEPEQTIEVDEESSPLTDQSHSTQASALLSLQDLVGSKGSGIKKIGKSDRVRVDLELLAMAAKQSMQRKKKSKNSAVLVGPAEQIGCGDSVMAGNIVSYEEADAAFYTLKRTVEWQKMYHRKGEVPRLVAVQGAIDEGMGAEPIYRHPADESPEMLPFSETVNVLRTAAEKHVGHNLNHVLIQYYRNGEDNISEHSDKTLDIVRGSSIVNFSLGAQRVMTLRSKRDPSLPLTDDGEGQGRRIQRVPLMHNSIFVLGQVTNQHWLHSVRADKRPASEKGTEELAYGGERISLTFRQIGTFVSYREGLIWGQGARHKTRDEAGKLLAGEDAEKEGENMIKAFGQENHLSSTWDWDEWYGKGFDVVNFENKSA